MATRLEAKVFEVLRASYAVVLLTAIVLPMLLIIPVSFTSSSYLAFPPRGFSLAWYHRVLVGRDWLHAMVLSFQIATLTMCASTLLGTLAAIGLVRWRFRGRDLLQSFLLSPMIVPAIVVGIATYNLWAQFRLVDTILGVVLAYTILATPFVLVNVTAALQGLNALLEAAALSLGANHVKAFWHVTLPLIRPSVINGALFSFLVAFDEIVVALFITGPHTMTLPRKLWDGVRYEINPSVAVVASLLMALEVVVFITAGLIARGRLRANTT